MRSIQYQENAELGRCSDSSFRHVTVSWRMASELEKNRQFAHVHVWTGQCTRARDSTVRTWTLFLWAGQHALLPLHEQYKVGDPDHFPVR